ncbi:uncharacterized protein LOC135401482 [Ornithodoros turicata]|uniref:uncharacterized protein LOC135401482 n=1 Tax=Ornithodoros turicata TaxID=34597 RepID=UPI00313873AF
MLSHHMTSISVLLCAAAVTGSPQNESNVPSHRRPKIGLFNWVRFQNEPCMSENGFSGVCFTSAECSLLGGKSSGTCAQGFGVCCQVTKTCGETIRSNNTYFVDPSYTGGGLGMKAGSYCSVTVEKVNPNVCQLRLDMERFDIVGPNTFPISGECTYDTFSVTGQDASSPVPVICGINHGQHMYVNVGQPGASVQLRMSLAPKSTQRAWKIRVTQIPCNSPRQAPSGCLQYHEEPTGIISSFNYDIGTFEERGYPNNLHYSICFRRATGTCRVRFSNEGPFGVGAEPVVAGRGVAVNQCQAFQLGSQMQSDFLRLGLLAYCGNRFPPAYETDDTGVMLAVFVSAGTHSPLHRGFRLRYTLVACS